MMIAAVRHSARTTTNTVEDSESTTGRGRSEPGHPDLQWGGWGVALAVTHQLRMLLGEGGGNASCVPRSIVKIAPDASGRRGRECFVCPQVNCQNR